MSEANIKNVFKTGKDTKKQVDNASKDKITSVSPTRQRPTYENRGFSDIGHYADVQVLANNFISQRLNSYTTNPRVGEYKKNRQNIKNNLFSGENGLAPSNCVSRTPMGVSASGSTDPVESRPEKTTQDGCFQEISNLELLQKIEMLQAQLVNTNSVLEQNQALLENYQLQLLIQIQDQASYTFHGNNPSAQFGSISSPYYPTGIESSQFSTNLNYTNQIIAHPVYPDHSNTHSVYPDQVNAYPSYPAQVNGNAFYTAQIDGDPFCLTRLPAYPLDSSQFNTLPIYPAGFDPNNSALYHEYDPFFNNRS